MQYQPIEQFNKGFMANNPQYAPKPAPTLPQYQPMGTPAKSPQTGIAAPDNAISPNNANISSATSSTGIATPPQPQNASFPGLVGSLAQTATQGTPEVQKANQDLLDFKKSYANYQNAVGTEPNPFGFQTGVGQLAGNRYASLLPAYEQAVTNAQTSQGQRIGGLGSAAGLAAPQQVSPGNFYVNPQTGQDVSGGTITPGAGGARMAMVGQGKQAQDNVPLINTAAGYVNDFNRTLQTSGLLASDLNVSNLLSNLYASNTSNPAYPKLQQQFNNAISFYAQVLGQDPSQLVSSLASTGRGSTLSSLFQNLDKQARDYNQNLIQSSQSSNPASTNIQPLQPQSPQPGTGSVYNGVQLPH